jgi:hypothetical protein
VFTALNRTVDRDHGLGEQVQPSAKHDELAAGRPDRWPVVLAEIGNGLEIRHEASGQPHQFDVPLGLPLQAPARRDAVEIAVKIDLQQRRWMVSRAPGGLGNDTVEAQCCQIQFVDERFNHPDRVVLRHVVIQAVR